MKPKPKPKGEYVPKDKDLRDVYRELIRREGKR